MNKALLVVDVQKDFTEGGALGCDGGSQVAKDVIDLMREGSYDVLVSSQDWHDPDNDNGGHFAPEGEEPDFKDTWVRHCVAGTQGAEYRAPLEGSLFDYRILKGQGVPAYSAFEGTEAVSGETLEQLLHSRDVVQIDIVGIATDYCVRASALDAIDAGFKVRVLLDYCAHVDGATADEAVALMISRGVQVSNSSRM